MAKRWSVPVMCPAVIGSPCAFAGRRTAPKEPTKMCFAKGWKICRMIPRPLDATSPNASDIPTVDRREPSYT
jgi:hypothetical protein